MNKHRRTNFHVPLSTIGVVIFLNFNKNVLFDHKYIILSVWVISSSTGCRYYNIMSIVFMREISDSMQCFRKSSLKTYPNNVRAFTEILAKIRSDSQLMLRGTMM